MRIVLDTNVLIDAFRDEYSYEKRIIDEVINGSLEAFANNQTLRENKLILNQLISSADYEQTMRDFFGQVNPVQNRRQISVVSDPEDNKILESAVEAKADYLITKDNSLLSIKEYQAVEIVTPIEFWTKYKDEGQDLWKQWSEFVQKNNQ